jgi:vanillate O-demethylase monooxygenase subunit
MFLRNNWYVAGFGSEIGETPLARRICDEPVVLFRTASGQAAALEDRCIHRGMPLSAGGECSGDIIRCPYHGLEFDASGACVRIPGQERVPQAAKITSYPLVERDAFAWIWIGDRDLADPSKIVQHPYHSDAAWAWRGGSIEIEANWQLIADNLLDLSHLQYVHRKTIGGNPEEEKHAELSTQREGDAVIVKRWLRNVDCPPAHRASFGFKGKVDRWQEFVFRPGVLQFHSGAMDANTGAFEGKRDGGMHIRHFHGVTPKTETSTNYFYSSARSFRIDDDELTERMRKATLATFMEDKVILEAQQIRLRERPNAPMLNIKSDAAVLHGRRIVESLIAQEQTRRI